MMKPSSSSNSFCIMAISGSGHHKTRFAALCKRGDETVIQDARVLQRHISLKKQVISVLIVGKSLVCIVDSMQPTS